MSPVLCCGAGAGDCWLSVPRSVSSAGGLARCRFRCFLPVGGGCSGSAWGCYLRSGLPYKQRCLADGSGRSRPCAGCRRAGSRRACSGVPV